MWRSAMPLHSPMERLRHLNKVVMAKDWVQTLFLYLQTFLPGPTKVLLVHFGVQFWSSYSFIPLLPWYLKCPGVLGGHRRVGGQPWPPGLSEPLRQDHWASLPGTASPAHVPLPTQVMSQMLTHGNTRKHENCLLCNRKKPPSLSQDAWCPEAAYQEVREDQPRLKRKPGVRKQRQPRFCLLNCLPPMGLLRQQSDTGVRKPVNNQSSHSNF